MTRSRSPEARARQRRHLIRDALAAVDALSVARLTELGASAGLAADDVRADLRLFAEREPRRALTAFAREVHLNKGAAA